MTELEYWTQQIKKGRVSRREFMGRAAALGVTTVLATSLLAKAGVAQEGKRGGYAKFGLPQGSTTDTLDPANYPDSGTQVPFWGSMSNSLTEVDADGNVQPDLAEAIERSEDAKQWVFKLRKGVTFHNGKDLTAGDVVASYRHHMGEGSKSVAKSILAPITELKADGKDTVILDCCRVRMPIFRSRPATTISRSCRPRTTAPSTGSQACGQGRSRPSAFAVLRLTAISNFVGSRTGRSAGFSPLSGFLSP